MFHVIGRWLLHVFFRLFFRYQIEGREHIPREGGVLIAANHASALDPPLLGCASPRQVYFMAKAELFSMPVLSWLLPRVGAFPVHRGAADRSAIRSAIEYLKQGNAVVIFPEGTRTRTGELLPLQRGAGLIALKAGVPVVPVGLVGTFRPLRIKNGIPRLNRIIVRFGEPIDLSEYAGRDPKEAVEEINQRMMKSIAALVR